MVSKTKYIPALSFRWLTSLQDPFLKWGMREEAFKRRLIEQAKIQDEFQRRFTEPGQAPCIESPADLWH